MKKDFAAFTSQISMGIENAKLFDDVQNQKNYSESIFSSMHDAVLTIDENSIIKTCNTAGLRILKFLLSPRFLNIPSKIYLVIKTTGF